MAARRFQNRENPASGQWGWGTPLFARGPTPPPPRSRTRRRSQCHSSNTTSVSVQPGAQAVGGGLRRQVRRMAGVTHGRVGGAAAPTIPGSTGQRQSQRATPVQASAGAHSGMNIPADRPALTAPDHDHTSQQEMKMSNARRVNRKQLSPAECRCINEFIDGSQFSQQTRPRMSEATFQRLLDAKAKTPSTPKPQSSD
jgi:hypothetical protein